MQLQDFEARGELRQRNAVETGEQLASATAPRAA